MALPEPYRPTADELVYIVRTHGDKAAVLLRTGRHREYEAHELTEPYSALVERLHREGAGAWHGPIARAEHRERLALEDRARRLKAERDEARTAFANAEQTIDELRVEVRRLRA